MSEQAYTLGIDIGSTTVKIAILDEQYNIQFSDYKRHFANIQETLSDLLQEASAKLGDITVHPMITGSGGLTLANHLGVPFTQEVIAVSTALTKEVTDRKSEITRVEGKISDEAAARQEADNAIKASIASIDLSTKADVSALTKEVTDRKSEITRVEGLIPTIKVDDVKVDGVSVVANKVANIDLSNKADTTALTQVSAAIESKADTTALTEVSEAIESKADSSALTQVSTALTKEISDRKSEITRVEGLIQGGGGSSSGGVSTEELTDDEQTIAAAFQEQKINIDALRLSIETLKKRISSLEKALKAKA